MKQILAKNKKYQQKRIATSWVVRVKEILSDLAIRFSSTTCVLQQVGQVKMGTFYRSQWLTFKATNQLFHRDDLYLVNCERLSADDPGEAEGEVTKHT